MKLRWLFFVLMCLPSWLYAHEVLDKFLRELHTLQAQFVQKLYNEKGSLLESSQGKMYMQRPNRFHWDYQQPYNQLIVADGERVWIYDSDLEQVTVKNLDQALGKTPAFLLSSSRRMEEDFFINLLSSKNGVMRFELIPKDAQASFDSMRINLSGKKMLGLELIDNLGQTTFITFNKMKQNQKLSKELFIFTPPAGVDIITDDN
ncbi:MAG: outer membrane lipoprotein carrier protein LolA [Gammaproteobacteria bacterium]|nr:MAG: outer membrane lipoprotein carrier protein LolA [Gammaproteobacteria bacterium]RKZ40250.1 MAG: outer membrane lipoprotein carrier protein LolA [Gammaproteobacteria bacterium]RKZ76912.1 MAG: outer membrane lipoprotein carrier protein LolA [Gammaproteobacteria bacterium]